MDAYLRASQLILISLESLQPYLLYWLFMQEYETGSDSQKFPVGTKVQAVYSEDGEWYV